MHLRISSISPVRESNIFDTWYISSSKCPIDLSITKIAFYLNMSPGLFVKSVDYIADASLENVVIGLAGLMLA